MILLLLLSPPITFVASNLLDKMLINLIASNCLRVKTDTFNKTQPRKEVKIAFVGNKIGDESLEHKAKFGIFEMNISLIEGTSDLLNLCLFLRNIYTKKNL